MRPLEQGYPNNRVLITGATGGGAWAGRRMEDRRDGLDATRSADTTNAVKTAGSELLEILLNVTRCENFEAAAKRVTEAWQGLDVFVKNTRLERLLH